MVVYSRVSQSASGNKAFLLVILWVWYFLLFLSAQSLLFHKRRGSAIDVPVYHLLDTALRDCRFSAILRRRNTHFVSHCYYVRTEQ